MRIKGKKATVSITLPPKLLEKARELGLNISKITENALKLYIERLEGSKTETNGGINNFLGEASLKRRFFEGEDSVSANKGILGEQGRPCKRFLV